MFQNTKISQPLRAKAPDALRLIGVTDSTPAANIRIRCVSPHFEHLRDALVRMHLQCFRPCELDFVLLAYARWWMAFDETDRALAFAGLAPHPGNGTTGYLCRAGVAPAARGQGLHRRLIRARLAFARKAGLAQVVTDTLRNTRCVENLEAFGFETYRPRRPWALTEAQYWRLDLWDRP